MLKALELIGFKSFADRTRFEFPKGITSIVGPNGSGKSNVVDAIKWVLGEQSVKSLRGKEMADVIFNGSSSRPLLNAAETTLTFDNSDGLLPIDTPEVHITRRVYRSGEGEYLINRQPCRLRDIRELFSGTGAATEAYSVIEQGKVDILLQSSPRDRRMIFEEAAGISRFKAKKLESLRRLERVDQNLLRLADIVEEVANRLRHVRRQAGKAQRYKSYNDRLQELRTALAMAEWRRLGEHLAGLEAQRTTLDAQIADTTGRAEQSNGRASALEAEAGSLAEQLRETEAHLADDRERIAGHEAAIDHARDRLRELEQQAAQQREQFVGLRSRAGDLYDQWQHTARAFDEAQQEHHELECATKDEQQTQAEIGQRLDAVRREVDRQRGLYLQCTKAVTTGASEIGARQDQATRLEAARDRAARRLVELDVEISAATNDRAAREQTHAAAVAAADQSALLVDNCQQRLASHREAHAVAVRQLSELRERHSGARERAALLQELEERFEGVGAGVKDFLLRWRENPPAVDYGVHDLVANLLQARVEMAPLIDLALGPAAQHLVVAGGAGFDSLLSHEATDFTGRIGFMRLDALHRDAQDEAIDFMGRPGVLDRADRCVETALEFLPLARQLLGRTWIVETLDQTWPLVPHLAAGGQIVTLAGEVVCADGSIIVGPRTAGAGLVSRRSELRALVEQIAGLVTEIQRAEGSERQLSDEIRAAEHDFAAASSARGKAQASLLDERTALGTAAARHDQLVDARGRHLGEEETATAELAATSIALENARASLRDNEAQHAAAEAALDQAAQQLEALDQERRAVGARVTQLQVRLAKSEERVANLRTQLRQIDIDQAERRRGLAERRTQLDQLCQRESAASRQILGVESLLAELYLRKERWSAECSELTRRIDATREQRRALADEGQQLRGSARAFEEERHRCDLAVSELRLERQTLAARLQEDYGIELATLQLDVTPLPADRNSAEEEIAGLRRKLNQLGNVNLEALDELEELETRHQTLSGQYQDLSKAKASLEQIVVRINADSRRLLGETLETVRGHFQGLFRKLFGGGQADILLEAGVDILESGIEIIARPPGKEPRNISLLSGGEKTLTCVALLLAIFRSRPSPFCVLDEVDAALDEANIERFIAVLKDFLAWTQFIIVTHSKKTMTCATTLYGVTMQESGVSKRVSVRFDDVSETGEILTAVVDDQPDDSVPRAGDETQAA